MASIIPSKVVQYDNKSIQQCRKTIQLQSKHKYNGMHYERIDSHSHKYYSVAFLIGVFDLNQWPVNRSSLLYHGPRNYIYHRQRTIKPSQQIPITYEEKKPGI